MKKASKAEVDKTCASLSKAGPYKQPDPTTQVQTQPVGNLSTRMLNLWTQTSVVLPFHQGVLKVFSLTIAPSTRIFNPTTWILILSTRNDLKGCVPKLRSTSTRKKHKVWAKYYSWSSSSVEDQTSVPVEKSAKPHQAPSEHNQQQDSTDPVVYRKVDMSDLPSQYAEEVETFRQILYIDTLSP